MKSEKKEVIVYNLDKDTVVRVNELVPKHLYELEFSDPRNCVRIKLDKVAWDLIKWKVGRLRYAGKYMSDHNKQVSAKSFVKGNRKVKK